MVFAVDDEGIEGLGGDDFGALVSMTPSAWASDCSSASTD